jgi:hypothetical protein
VKSAETVYAPSFVGGSGGDKVDLKSDRPNKDTDPSQQGDFSQNPGGQSTVPIGSVAGQASSQADKAMDAERVPGALRGVIKDYFTGLQTK